MTSTPPILDCRLVCRLPEFLSQVQLAIGKLPGSLEDITGKGASWQATRGRFLLRIPQFASFLVEDGRSITVEYGCKAGENTGRDMPSLPLAALLYQQGRLAIHGAALADSRGAILLAGDSVSGKSTLLTALLMRGWSMLSDELAALDYKDERWQVWPTDAGIYLWPDAATKLNIGKQWPLLPQGRRYYLSPANALSTRPLPLRAIFWLNVHNFAGIERRAISGLDCFRTIGSLAYNTHVAAALLDREKFLTDAAGIAGAVSMYSLRRPRGRWTVEELADEVEAE